MATWKKVIVSGSTANLAALQVDNLTNGQLVVGGGSANNLGSVAINGTGSILGTTGATGVSMIGAFSGSFSGSLTSSLTNVAKANLVAYDTVTGQFSYVATSSISSATASYINPLTQSVVVSGSIQVLGGGILQTGYFTSSYTDGLITDYLSPYGRFIVGAGDGFAFYNGYNGTTSSSLMTININGQVTASTFVGNLTGTASFATFAPSSSYSVQATSASYAVQSTSASFAAIASNPLLGIVTASVVATTITFTKGNGTTFDITVAQSGSVASASYASIATTSSYAVSSSYASALTNALTFGSGLSGSISTFNGSAVATVAISGSATLTSNLIPKWTGTGLANSNITDNGTQVQIGAGATGGVTIAAGGIGVTGNSTFNNNVTITGDLTVAGTASFTNTDNLTIRDKFVLINSGSTVLADSGWVSQYNVAGSGSAFYLEANSAGTYGRFAVAYDAIGTSTSLTVDEYVVTVKSNQASGPSAAPTWGGSSAGMGNMWTTTTGDIYIYS